MLQFIFKFDFGYDSLEAGEDHRLWVMVARAKIFMFFGVLVLNNLGMNLNASMFFNFPFLKRVLGKIVSCGLLETIITEKVYDTVLEPRSKWSLLEPF